MTTKNYKFSMPPALQHLDVDVPSHPVRDVSISSSQLSERIHAVPPYLKRIRPYDEAQLDDEKNGQTSRFLTGHHLVGIAERDNKRENKATTKVLRQSCGDGENEINEDNDAILVQRPSNIRYKRHDSDVFKLLPRIRHLSPYDQHDLLYDPPNENSLPEIQTQPKSPDTLTLQESVSFGSDNNSLEPVSEEGCSCEECGRAAEATSPTAYFLEAMRQEIESLSASSECDEVDSDDEASNLLLEDYMHTKLSGCVSVSFDRLIRLMDDHDPLPILLERTESASSDEEKLAACRNRSEVLHLDNALKLDVYGEISNTQFPFDETFG